MNSSILTSIKKLLGIDESYEVFDTDLIIHINTVLGILYQIGLGDKAFVITSSDEEWSSFLEDDQIEMVKTYVYLKVRKLFDPPQSSVMQSMDRMIEELEWRIQMSIEHKED